MKQTFGLTLLLLLLLSACAPFEPNPLPNLPFVITLTPETPTPEQHVLILATEASSRLAATVTETEFTTSTPTKALPSETATEQTATPTPSPTYIPFLPTATETLLPPLDLPTENPRAPLSVAWTGLPTYPGDSDPGLLFRLDYDPDVWAQTEGNFGDIVLGNRRIEYCTITPWSGRGLPIDLKVSHEFRVIGSASYDVNTVLSQGEVKFISYVGGDGHVLTGFQVSFNSQQNQCIQEAETILSTLRSLSAVPTITPSAGPVTPTP